MEDTERQGSSLTFGSYAALRSVQVSPSHIKSTFGNTFCGAEIGVEAGRAVDFL